MYSTSHAIIQLALHSPISESCQIKSLQYTNSHTQTQCVCLYLRVYEPNATIPTLPLWYTSIVWWFHGNPLIDHSEDYGFDTSNQSFWQVFPENFVNRTGISYILMISFFKKKRKRKGKETYNLMTFSGETIRKVLF